MNSFTSRKYYEDFEALNGFIPLCGTNTHSAKSE